MPLKLYNTLTRTIEPLRPIDPSHVTFYTCGPTVYDDAHIGNFRSFLAADVLRRFIESPLCELEGQQPNSARRVTHVMNITDVGHMTDDDSADGEGEDKMAVAGKRLLEQKKSGKLPADSKLDPNNPYDIASFYAMRFLDDARKLGLKVAIEQEKDPTLMPRATANVPGMIKLIALLIERGHAYPVGSPGSRVVYFDVSSFKPYGKLSGNTLDSLREGAGGRIAAENQSGKRNPADFLLWKEDPSHIMKWESPWGAGYPGWHIECSVMSAARLGTPALRAGHPLSPDELIKLVVNNSDPIIDLHSGGEDNIFPHHECELAQSCCAFNASHSGSYAGMWFHPRFLFVEGAKMSKSKGNFFTARDLFAKGYEPAAVRLELIRTHYRSNANFTEQGLKDSEARIRRWKSFARALMVATEHNAPWQGDPQIAELLPEVTRALADDLNIARVLAAIDKVVQLQVEFDKIWDSVMAGTPYDLRVYRQEIDSKQLPTKPMPPDEALHVHQRGVAQGTVAQHWAALHLVDNILGVVFTDQQFSQTEIGLFIGCDPDPAVIAKLNERIAAKKTKDFAKSDAIRNELAALGYAIKDVAGGKVEVRRA